MAKYIELSNGTLKEAKPIVSSAGATDASKVVETDVDGRLHLSVIPTGLGRDLQVLPIAEAVAAGAFVNIFNESGVVKIRNADATSPSKSVHGFVLAANSVIGSNSTVYFEGVNNQLSALTLGATYFLSSTTPGQAVTPAPASSPGHILHAVGVAVSATEIRFEKHPYIERA